MKLKSFLYTMTAVALIAPLSLTSASADECVSGPLCVATVSPTPVVNPLLQGITLHAGGVMNFQSGGQVVAGVGEAWSEGEGGVVQDLGLVFTGAGICEDDPNCADIGVTGSLAAVGNASAGAFAVDDTLAQTAGMAQTSSVLQVQVLLGDLFPAD